MAIDRKQVETTAKLARLGLNESQIESLKTELSGILDYVNQLSKVDTSATQPLYHVLPIKNVTRPDVAEPAGVIDDALKGSANAHPPFFSVPKVLD